jgi:HK97 family phage major capsid protein/HK97 family phage prohead protease
MKKQLPDPNEYDDEDEFMEDCVDEIGDESICELIWENASYKGGEQGLKHKTHSSDVSGMEFVLSDETIDRMDDVIMSDGWDLRAFKKNPIALFNHTSNFPIGKWKNLRIEDKQLKGHLELAPSGTSDRVDEIRRLVEAGILKAVSVGFRPIEMEKREGSDWGYTYIKSELVETSLVAVPANPNALAVAKSLGVSPETIGLVFAGQGNGDRVKRRGFNGGHANRSSGRGGRQMSSLGQRIAALEEQINSKRDALNTHLEKMDDSNVSNSDLEITSKFNQDIGQLEKTREALIESEKRLAKSLDPNPEEPIQPHRAVVISGTQREQKITAPSVIVNRKPDSIDYVDLMVKAATLAYAAKVWGKPIEEARTKIGEKFPAYKEDGVRVMSELVLRAASAPAMTTVTGWAAELVHITYAALMPLLMPQSILTRLGPKGLVLDFGQTGVIRIPTRSRTPTIAGSFVGEGMAIPVRQGAFTTQSLTPKKMAVITTWTREMDQHSIPAIEGLLREAIQQDTSVAIDSVLIDSNPATTIRPAGLLNGVAATTATAGGGMAAFIGDLTGLISALSAATYGNIRTPVWLVNQADMLRASLLQATNTGIFPFRDEIRGGSLNGIPLIDSATIPSKTMILVDAADFVVVGGTDPRMEISDQATLHMEDTSPADLVVSPSTVAAPQKSLFQTDSLALRMVMPLNWVQRRAGTVAWTQSVTW